MYIFLSFEDLSNPAYCSLMSELRNPITVFVGDEHLSVRTLLSVIRKTVGPFLCVLPPSGLKHIEDEPLRSLLFECRAFHRDRTLIMASKDLRLLEHAKREGWETVKTVKLLRPLLKGDLSEAEALRVFSPVIWRENIRTRLQSAGILALPKVRIWGMLALSIGIFVFTFFKLLPSSEIEIWPNQETQNFTTNVYLSTSGALLPVSSDHVRILPLRLLTVNVSRTLTYDQISKHFTGTNAKMGVTVFNDADEQYSLRKGTRLINQAGMKFRLQEDLILEPHSTIDTHVLADPIDQYGEVLGERGNVPANVKWDFPGLSETERKLVYARNERPATGGSTSYVNVLSKEDIEGSKQHPGARQRLEQELLMMAKQQIEEEITSANHLDGTHFIQLQRDALTKLTFQNFSLSEDFIGQNVATIPIQGSIEYTVVLYDENELRSMLAQEVMKRVPSEKSVQESSLVKENMNVHVIAPWADDLSWVKLTADLTYNQRFIINPITPSGAKFGKYIRDNVAGKSIPEAYRIIKNLPEVSKAKINVWPPWTLSLPEIGHSIVITEKRD